MAKKTPTSRAGPLAAVDVRCSKALIARLDRWRNAQHDMLDRAAAIRRLMELALDAAKTTRRTSAKAAAKASEMAGQELDRMADKTASAGEQHKRKRRLLKGPMEFQNWRSDHPRRKRRS
jgi:hypothetical protein